MVKAVVLFKTAKGVMGFRGRKPIFQSRDIKADLKHGLGVIDESTLEDFNDYFVASIKNVKGVLPKTYPSIDHFKNIGVPKKFLMGTYGDSVIIKEVYRNREIIKAFDEDGNVILRESSKIKGDKQNNHFTRIDAVVTEWKDITEDFLHMINISIITKHSDLNLLNSYLLYSLKGLERNKVVKLKNGFIVADGKYESLLVWGNGEEISMSWYGRKFDFKGFNGYEDITEEVSKNISTLGL